MATLVRAIEKIGEPTRQRRGDSSPAYADELAAELRSRIRGEVRFDNGSRALYSTDGSNYRQVPIGVVIPKDSEDVEHTVAVCRTFRAPILARGGGTSLAGQCCNVAVVMDFSKYMNQILELDADSRRARVQPGLVLDVLRGAAEKYHLTFGPDPATHNHCTLGGMIGNNSCGIHSVMAGKTDDNIDELEILTYDGLRMRVGPTSEQDLNRIVQEGGRRGDIYRRLRALRDKYANEIRSRYPNIPRRVSGYNLPQLLPENGFNVARALVGTECTCVMVLEATARLVESPPVRSLLVLGYPDIYQAGDHVMEILGAQPIGLEGIDEYLVENMKRKGLHPRNLELLPPGQGWLLVEFGGNSKQESDGHARRLMDKLKSGNGHAPSMKLYDDPKQEELVWKIRESGLGATAFVPGEPVTWEGWEDSAVPPDKVGPYLRDLQKLYDKYGYKGALYGHFGQGCIHTRISFDFTTADGIAKYRAFMNDAADLVLSYGGSLSGEHGDGQSRAELLPKMFGDELIQAFREFKAIWDPEGKMNPHKVVDPYRIDENLRLGTDYHPPQPATHFKFPDEGGFSGAALRCVGVGECRKHGGGTMCPSYMVTFEEEHSTRGRSRLLFEMVQGEVIQDGWKSEAVRDALDLCLACKGCKGECPVEVDMASYKAEFLSHYYEGRLRPRSAYAMGLIHRWARIGTRMPRLTNALSHMPVVQSLMKAAAGIAQEREIPKFATRTFRDWFRKRPITNWGKKQVLLWPDTFNNYFHPATAAAGVEVLEDAGFQVILPEDGLCCGRPLYDYGMLDTAERTLERTLRALKAHIRAGTPMVGLEPSCVAVFRDEMCNLFPDDEDAKRLRAQTFTLHEFLQNGANGYKPPALHRKVVVHGHCHDKAIMKLATEEQVLAKMGADCEVLASGCCGMAGSFGFEAEHYDISMKIGERVLLPAVEKASKDTIVLSDGFSCREQISQATDRHGLHLAQLIQMAKREGAGGPAGDYPEKKYLDLPRLNGRSSRTKLVMAGAAGAIGAGLAWWMMRRAGARREF